MKIQTVPGIFLPMSIVLLHDRGRRGVAPNDDHRGEAAAELAYLEVGRGLAITVIIMDRTSKAAVELALSVD